MSLSDHFKPEDVLLASAARTRSEVLKTLADRCADARRLDAGRVARALADREALGSTGVGEGVAMPHAAIAGLDAPFVAVARLAAPVDWQAIDDVAVDLVVLVLSPTDGPTSSLNLIAQFARRLRSPERRARLRAAKTVAAFYDAFLEDVG